MKWLRFMGIVVVLLALLSLSSFYVVRSLPKPPVQLIDSARVMIAEAKLLQADIYSANLYDSALKAYDAAMTAWRNENQRFIFRRNFKTTDSLARTAIELAMNSITDSKHLAESLELRTAQKLDELNRLILHHNGKFSRFPLSKGIQRSMSKGKVILNEAQIEFQNKSFVAANDKVNQAEYYLKSSFRHAEDAVKEYFKAYPEWINNFNSTVQESKNKKSAAVIVDKFAAKCYLYKNGQLIHTFDAELGKNWVGDKQYKGDFATPEGKYMITQKKEKSSTKYYKALLINYPNDDDKERFRKALKEGRLTKSASIGGLIEIHGHGGRGADWTEGCVALRNEDMDILYRNVSVGTPVTIVGSLKDIKEILSSNHSNQ